MIINGRVLRQLKHPTKRIKHGSLEANVDKGIATLILLLWKRSLPTLYCCEGYSHYPFGICQEATDAYIMFRTRRSLLDFIAMVSTAIQEFRVSGRAVYFKKKLISRVVMKVKSLK